ncbi:MAG: DUF3443 family protein [Betaproteobacteria bacterium]|nr:DUF3443 family protein [Betaproteobacteria bacterium]
MISWFLRLFVLVPLSVLLLNGCGGGGGSSSGSTSTGSVPTADCNAAATPPTLASNQALMSVSQNPSISGYSTVNLPYVTVTVCNGTNCKSIDHVVVDSGSYGLRLLHSVASSLGFSTAPTFYECAQFLSGYMWGGVYNASVQIAGEATSSPIPIEIIDDDNTASMAPPPFSCTSGNSSIGTLNGIGGNGLLGVGPFIADNGNYYQCTGSTCITAVVPTANQVSNPVAFFAVDNNGLIMQMPAVSGLACPSAAGSITFGIDTQTNNSLQNYSTLALDNSGNFTAAYSGQIFNSSFIDSGSNYNFLIIPGMSYDNNGNYRPTQYTTISPVTFTPNTGPPASITTSLGVIDPYVLNSTYTAVNDIAALGSAGSADFGMPFFYGKSIATVIAGHHVSEGNGPMYALH